MAALQLVLVCFTLVALLGLVPLLYFVSHWYLVQQSPLEAWESPQRSLSRKWSSFGRDSPVTVGYSTPDANRQRGNGRVHGDLGSVQDGAAASAEGTEVEEGSLSRDAEPSRQLQADALGARSWLGACQVKSARKCAWAAADCKWHPLHGSPHYDA